jgi:hypothetical protein
MYVKQVGSGMIHAHLPCIRSWQYVRSYTCNLSCFKQCQTDRLPIFEISFGLAFSIGASWAPIPLHKHLFLPCFLTDTLFRISFPATSPSDTFTHYHPLSTSFISRMAATAVEPAPVEVPGLPDYVLDPNATLKDATATWRHGRAPDYSQTRKVYEESTSISSNPRTTSTASIF